MSYQPRNLPRKAPMAQRRAQKRPRDTVNGRRPGVAGNAVFLLLALAVVGLMVGVAVAFSNISAAPLADASGQSAASAAAPAASNGDAWIPLRSQAPADIIAAARQSSLFQESRSDTGDHVRDLSRLGRPVYVRAVRTAGVSASDVPDFYIVPILNQAGAATDAAELALNPSHTAVQVIAIVTYTTPRAGGSVAAQGADQAVHAVAIQRQESAQAISQPYLVYFPMDPTWQASQNGQPAWMAGGALPADPVWFVTATDGKQFLAGNDGRLYAVSQLPVWHGQ